jgi:hypothetical protein
VATDPKTGAPVSADPAKTTTGTQVSTDPKTGAPVATDPKTGTQVSTDPKTGAPVATDPKTGTQVSTDPKTGAPVATDPKTGLPIATDPSKTLDSTRAATLDQKAPTTAATDSGKTTAATGIGNNTNSGASAGAAAIVGTSTNVSGNDKVASDKALVDKVLADSGKTLSAVPGDRKTEEIRDAAITKEFGTFKESQTTSRILSNDTVSTKGAEFKAPSDFQTTTSVDKNGSKVTTFVDKSNGYSTTITLNPTSGVLVTTYSDPSGNVLSVSLTAPNEATRTYNNHNGELVLDTSTKPQTAILPPAETLVKSPGTTGWSMAPDSTGQTTLRFDPGAAPIIKVNPADSSSQNGGTLKITLDANTPQVDTSRTNIIRLEAGINTSMGNFSIEFTVPVGYVPPQGGSTIIMMDPNDAARVTSGNTKISYVTPDGQPANLPPSTGNVVWTDYDGRPLTFGASQGTVEILGVQPATPGNTQQQQYPIKVGNEDVSVGIGINPATGNPSVQIGLGPVDIILGGGSANQQPTTGQYPTTGYSTTGQYPTSGQYPTEPVVNVPTTGVQQPQQPQYPINFGNGDVNVGVGFNPTTGNPSLHVDLGPIGFDIGGSPRPAPVTDPYNSGYQPPQYSNTGNVPTNNGSYVDPYGAEHWYDPLGQIVKTLTPDGTNVIYNDDGSRLVYGGNSPTPAFIPPSDSGQIYSGTQVPVNAPVVDPYVGTAPVNYGTPITPPVSYSDPLQPPYSGYPVNDPYVPNPSTPYTPQPTPPLPFEPAASTPAPVGTAPSDPVSTAPAGTHDPLQLAQQQQHAPSASQQPQNPEDIANKLTVNFEPLRPEVAEPKPEAKAPIILDAEDRKDSSGSLLSDYEHRIRENQNVVHNDGAEGLKGAGIDADQKSHVSAAEATAMAAETQAAINALMQHLANERHEDYTEAVQAEDRKYSEITEELRESKQREDDTYRKHAELIADLREKELEGYKKRAEAVDRKEKEDEDAKKLTDTMLTVMATRRENDAIIKARQDAFWAEQQKKEEQVRQDNKQTKYLVRPNDTIEAIAGKRLRDPRLAELIYEINKDKIEIRYENGKKVYVVKEGCVLTLPSPRQIREFRQQQRLGILTNQDTSGNVVDIDSKAAADQRRANVEKLLGKIGNAAESAASKYNVRLGDTLRSVAMKHPQLGDVTLWKLLAEKNGLSTTTDHKGVPTSALRRGTQIILPTTEEIAQYRDRMRGDSITSWNSSRYETHSRQCPNCHRLTTTEASNCPGCTYAFNGVGKEVDVEVQNQPLIAASTISATITSAVPTPRGVQEDVSEATTVSHAADEEDNTVITGGKGANSFNVLSENLDPDERKWVEETIINSLIEKLGENCRVVETTSADSHVVRTQLEVLTGDTWIPILSYEINENTSVRYEFASDGKQRTMPIDLPAAAAQELIHNDLQSNWQEYCRKFLAGKRLTA